MSVDELDPAAVAQMVEALRAVVPADRVTSAADIGEDTMTRSSSWSRSTSALVGE